MRVHRFVKVIKVDTRNHPWLQGQNNVFYMPVYYSEPWIGAHGHIEGGRNYPMVNEDECSYVWGFETLAEAQKIVDAANDQDAQDEAESLCRNDRGRGDREDFHADG